MQKYTKIKLKVHKLQNRVLTSSSKSLDLSSDRHDDFIWLCSELVDVPFFKIVKHL